MNDRLADAVSRVETIITEMQQTRSLQSVDGRRRILNLRKQLADSFAALGPAYRSSGGIERQADPDFEQRLAGVRRAIALHQTTWPAALLDERTPDYLGSADQVRAQIRGFLTWVRETCR